MLEERVLELSKDQKASLPKIISRAKEKNFPGITFTNKSASFFISDCVDIANDYIPIVIYNIISDPIEKLKGKVTKNEIEDFMKRLGNASTKCLLLIMLNDIKNKTEFKISLTRTEEKIEDVDSVYGVYGEISSERAAIIEEEKEVYSEDDLESIQELLIKILEAK